MTLLARQIFKKFDCHGDEIKQTKDIDEEYHTKFNVKTIPDGLKKTANPWLYIDALDSEEFPLIKTNDRQYYFS